LNNESKIIKGPVLASRSPSVHPGDVQMFECVNIQELNHLSNVVVFSSKGIRPDASKMSCGDLDGDVYLVIWDQNLLRLVEQTMIR
jgi:RNA-dependent RNA polymerase